MTQKAAIIGDGQMGLVLADALAERGVSVRLWGPFPEDLDELASTRQSPRRLPDFMLPHVVEVTSDPGWVLKGADCIINAIPTQFIRRVWEQLRPHVPTRVPVACVSKGIEVDTLMRPTQIIADVLGEDANGSLRPTCSLSGPTIAAELARRLPATMVAASHEPALAQAVQDLFRVPWLRIYRHEDPLGVELAGATKNVIALAAGMVDGLRAGDNAKSALLARGLAEIARLGTALGARVDTFFGIAGVGDLATTCFSPSGRNRGCGERLGKGETLEEILASTVSVVEGVPTTKSVMRLTAQWDVSMPITKAVHGILFEGLTPREAIADLMGRELKAERIGQ
ncbi:MAG: NAD(P)-dependent glycerol-3-phosphate dehydrogenase [Phycisphaerales bacterium]|nr:MAG: NAD(P)-dependent glycerol-3-phosphate dehydrogenase [Phycisphaerales bacterium]